MREIQLGEWLIRCLTTDYSLWKNSDEASIIVEYNSSKIATVTLEANGSYVILSDKTYCEVNEAQHLIIFWSPTDKNISVVI
ncbi:MAG: hypothetical protein P4L69_08595 [Desulfosporosinus sp.]|nr:hypothetical protein [Desulfosporosinus sp.]